MIKITLKTLNNRRGSVINVALLILILIFLIGLGLHKLSTTDVKISTNMKTQATTFYETEAGLEAASELAELNALCAGFSDTDTGTDGLPAGWENIEGVLMVTDLDLWSNSPADSLDFNRAGDPLDPKLDPALFEIVVDAIDACEANPADPNCQSFIDACVTAPSSDLCLYSSLVDAYYPPDHDGSEEEHTYISIGGETRFATGSAIQMAAGYEGLGRGSAVGGGNIVFDILVRRYGRERSTALHTIQWVHKIGVLGSICNY
jgi:hypothetical protein